MIPENWKLQMSKNKPQLWYPIQRLTQSKCLAIHLKVWTETITLLEGNIEKYLCDFGWGRDNFPRYSPQKKGWTHWTRSEQRASIPQKAVARKTKHEKSLSTYISEIGPASKIHNELSNNPIKNRQSTRTFCQKRCTMTSKHMKRAPHIMSH